MKNNVTCLTVLALLLLADAISIAQTLEFGGSSRLLLLTAEGVAAGIFAAAGIWLFCKRFARQKKAVSHRPVAAAVQALFRRRERA